MRASLSPIVVVGGVVSLLAVVVVVWSCDEAICGSLVSKCLLLKSCECNMLDKANCTCCKDCHRCLARLYTECCSCVGMCAEHSDKLGAARTSSVEVLDDPIPELFTVLTEEEDPYLRWSTHTYPAHLDLLYFTPPGASLSLHTPSPEGEEHGQRHSERHGSLLPEPASMNCTVAYMSQCMSLNKCKVGCQSMGAARYRWFHEHGCCECIGSTCLDYGKGEALCLQCPPAEGSTEEDDYYDDYHEQSKYHEESTGHTTEGIEGTGHATEGMEVRQVETDEMAIDEAVVT